LISQRYFFAGVDISPKDPRWIGAWWLGFLVFGAFSLLFSIPTMCFPRYIKSSKRRHELALIAKERELAKLDKKSLLKTIVEEAKGVLKLPAYSVTV